MAVTWIQDSFQEPFRFPLDNRFYSLRGREVIKESTLYKKKNIIHAEIFCLAIQGKD